LFIFYALGILLSILYSLSLKTLIWAIICTFYWAFVTNYYYRNFCRHKEIEKFLEEQMIKARFNNCAPEDIIDADYKVVK